MFNYLISSMSRDVQVQVSTCTAAAKIWKMIREMTALQSCGDVINTCMALATAQKRSSMIVDFFSKMKVLADDMAAAGKKLEDKEITSYILVGLDTTFDPVVSSMASRVEPLTLSDLYTQLLSWEQRMDLVHGGCGSSANTVARGGGHGGFSYGGGGRGCGGHACVVATTTAMAVTLRTPMVTVPHANSPARRAHRAPVLQVLRHLLHSTYQAASSIIDYNLLWYRYELVHRHGGNRSHHWRAREAHYP